MINNDFKVDARRSAGYETSMVYSRPDWLGSASTRIFAESVASQGPSSENRIKVFCITPLQIKISSEFLIYWPSGIRVQRIRRENGC